MEAENVKMTDMQDEDNRDDSEGEQQESGDHNRKNVDGSGTLIGRYGNICNRSLQRAIRGNQNIKRPQNKTFPG